MLPPCVRSTSLKLGEEENSEGNLETCLKKKNKGGGGGHKGVEQQWHETAGGSMSLIHMTNYYIKNYKNTAEIATYYTNNEFLPRGRNKLSFFRFPTK